MVQCQVLNKILSTGDASLIILNNLNDTYFSDYPKEFHFIKDHLDAYGKVPDLATFVNKFSDFDVVTVNEPDSYLIGELQKDKNKRFLASEFNKMKALVMSDDIDRAVSAVKNMAEELSQAVSLSCVDILSKDAKEARCDTYMKTVADSDNHFVSTGFKELDNILTGWDRYEELATIVARPNVGKSWILLKCVAAAAEQGLNVGLYSGEMSELKVGYRIDTLLSHISNGALVHGNSTVMNDYERYAKSGSKVPGSIKVLTPQMINGPAGCTALRAFIEKEHLDILFVDQHSLLEDDRKAKNPVEKAANISRDLKLLQVIKRVPIISVSQINRDTDAPDALDRIAQTDRIGQDSTVVIFLERKDDILKMTLQKSRDTDKGAVLQYNVDFNKGIFTYIPNEKDAAKEEVKSEYNNRYGDEPAGENVF